MHSFQPSRGRILFEVIGALVVSASCVGAWMQTGAWAMLPAAIITLLYGLIHAFDGRGRKPAMIVEPQRIDFTSEPQEAARVRQLGAAPLALADKPLTSDAADAPAEAVKPALSKTGKNRRTKAPGKGSPRRASVPKGDEAAEISPSESPELTVVASHEEEAAHHSLAPLFEPEPFARQRHAVFGRKAG
jgi:hypothetical protein